MNALQSLIACGTKLWLDSVDPELVLANRALGASGATSNPIIIADLIKSGRFDGKIREFFATGASDAEVAWRLTDELVSSAEAVFKPVWEKTQGNDGYVSFELDPLVEDLSEGERVARYVALGKQWAKGHPNRMIKVPATTAGVTALEDLAASGVNLNVTLIFTMAQYERARTAIWRGAQRRSTLAGFKSVYSIFVSRLDVYTEKAYPSLSPAAQGQVGIVNAKQIWRANKEFWSQQRTTLEQEMVFASTGTKKPSDPPWKYVEAFAGSDIETNPPATNAAVEKSGMVFTSHIRDLPPAGVLNEIQRTVNWNELEHTLMEEGLAKFAEPQKELLKLIAAKRCSL